MKLLLLNILVPVVLLLALFSNSFAQKKEFVYLKNGSIIEGRIVDSSDNVIKIYTKCNCTWAFQKNEIEKIENRFSGDYENKGFANFSTLDLLFGRNDNSIRFSAGLNTVNGLYYANKFYTGLGVGIEFFDYGIIPLFIDFKYFLNDKKVAPFVDLQAGWSIPIQLDSYWYNQKRYGGINLSGEIGVRKSITDSFAYTFSVGYRYQELKSENEYWNWAENVNYQSTTYQIYNSIFLKMGFVF